MRFDGSQFCEALFWVVASLALSTASAAAAA